MLAFHTGRQIRKNYINSTSSSLSINESDESTGRERLPLEERLRNGINDRPPITTRLLRKYIAYAKAYVHPK